MDWKKLGTSLLPLAGIALTAVAGIISSKQQEIAIDKAVTKKVAEALADQAKES
jgi:uncharacterized membrane protein